MVPYTLLALIIVRRGAYPSHVPGPPQIFPRDDSESPLLLNQYKRNRVHATSSNIPCRPDLFLRYWLSSLSFGHRCLKVTLREWVAGRPLQAFLDQLRKELPHPPQFVLEELQPFFHREYLFFNLLGDPHNRMHLGVDVIESELFVFTVIADELLPYRTGQ